MFRVRVYSRLMYRSVIEAEWRAETLMGASIKWDNLAYPVFESLGCLGDSTRN